VQLSTAVPDSVPSNTPTVPATTPEPSAIPQMAGKAANPKAATKNVVSLANPSLFALSVPLLPAMPIDCSLAGPEPTLPVLPDSGAGSALPQPGSSNSSAATSISAMSARPLELLSKAAQINLPTQTISPSERPSTQPDQNNTVQAATPLAAASPSSTAAALSQPNPPLHEQAPADQDVDSFPTAAQTQDWNATLTAANQIPSIPESQRANPQSDNSSADGFTVSVGPASTAFAEAPIRSSSSSSSPDVPCSQVSSSDNSLGPSNVPTPTSGSSSPAQVIVVADDAQPVVTTGKQDGSPHQMASPPPVSPNSATDTKPATARLSTRVAVPGVAKPIAVPSPSRRATPNAATNSLPHIFDDSPSGPQPSSAPAPQATQVNQKQNPCPAPGSAENRPAPAQSNPNPQTSAQDTQSTAQPPAPPNAVTSSSNQYQAAATGPSSSSQRKDSAPAAGPADSPQPAAPPVPVIAVADPAVKGTLAQASQPSTAPKPPSNDPPSASDSSVTPRAVELPATASVGPVQQAQMVNKAAQSEMRIGLNTSAFGSVEVRTVVRASDVGLVIGSEKGDLRSLLSNDLPGIANTLQQQNLRLTQVSFQQQGFAFSSNSSGGGHAQSRSYAPRANPTPATPLEPPTTETAPAAESRTGSHTGLSILA